MNRTEAIQKLCEEGWQVTPGLDFQVRRLKPEDAWGVARCFYAIYGAEYPIDTYYVPEKLIEENARGNVYSVVARASNGDIIGHGALYRSSCPHPRVFEIGQLMVLPEYRRSFAVFRLAQALQGEPVQAARPVELFGEAVCHHVLTQKMGYRDGYCDCAIEVGLMPAAAYPRTEFATDRVSALLHFRTFEDQQQSVYVPARYREQVEYIIAGLEVARTIRECGAAPPATAATVLHQEYFEFAQVARAHVRSVGADFDRIARAFDAESQQRGARVMQFSLNLGEAAVERAVELLRNRGYFFGGFLPRWFDSDALLLQKVLDLPDFRSIQLYTERARRIFDFICRDLNAITPKE